MIAQTNTHQYN